MRSRDTRPIWWVRAARKAFDSFPEGPQNAIMWVLTVAAEGRKADIAKPPKAFGSGIFLVPLQHRTDAYRVVYAALLEERVWDLHTFQKKAKQAIRTPEKATDLIGERLKRLKKEFRQ